MTLLRRAIEESVSPGCTNPVVLSDRVCAGVADVEPVVIGSRLALVVRLVGATGQEQACPYVDDGGEEHDAKRGGRCIRHGTHTTIVGTSGSWCAMMVKRA